MSEAKIEITIGQLSFSAQGEQTWLSEQLDKVLGRARDLIEISPAVVTGSGADQESTQAQEDTSKLGHIGGQSLASFLKSCKPTSQPQKFLATVVWLKAKEQSKVATRDITTALRNANQSRLGNASDCLNINVQKGYCERDGNQFFVTQEGMVSLGL